jgi:hypothetical protein
VRDPGRSTLKIFRAWRDFLVRQNGRGKDVPLPGWGRRVHAAWYFWLPQRLDHDALHDCRISLQLAGCHSTKAYR